MRKLLKKEDIIDKINHNEQFDFELLDEIDEALSAWESVGDQIRRDEDNKRNEINEIEHQYKHLDDLKKTKDILEDKIKSFAENDKKINEWQDNKMKLRDFTLQFKKNPESLEIGVSPEKFIKIFKEEKPEMGDYYKKFVKISVTLQKAKIKEAMKTGILGEDFQKKAELQNVQKEKFVIEKNK